MWRRRRWRRESWAQTASTDRVLLTKTDILHQHDQEVLCLRPTKHYPKHYHKIRLVKLQLSECKVSGLFAKVCTRTDKHNSQLITINICECVCVMYLKLPAHDVTYKRLHRAPLLPQTPLKLKQQTRETHTGKPSSCSTCPVIVSLATSAQEGTHLSLEARHSSQCQSEDRQEGSRQTLKSSSTVLVVWIITECPC